jgi:hypothetical protein
MLPRSGVRSFHATCARLVHATRATQARSRQAVGQTVATARVPPDPKAPAGHPRVGDPPRVGTQPGWQAGLSDIERAYGPEGEEEGEEGEEGEEDDEEDDDEEEEEEDAFLHADSSPEPGDAPDMLTAVEPAVVMSPSGWQTRLQAADIMSMAPRIPWVSLPGLAVTLPVPTDERCGHGWRWTLSMGSGVLFGAPVASAIIAATCAATEAHEARAGRRFLPVRVHVRVYTGLAAGPLASALRHGGGLAAMEEEHDLGLSPSPLRPPLVVQSASAWAASALGLGRALGDLHMLRHGPSGELGGGRGTRRPRLLHSWRDPVPDADAPLGSPHTLGLEYETLSDEHLSAVDLPVGDGAAALKAALESQTGGDGEEGAHGGLPATRLITMRHAVSFTLQPPQAARPSVDGSDARPAVPDCVHEVTVSAPSSAWDALWEGDEGDGLDIGSLEGAGGVWLQPGIVPSAADVGLAGVGLRSLFEACTITGVAEEGRVG